MSAHNGASPYQLPKTVAPRHYDILVEPDFHTFRFRSRAAIDIEVFEPVDHVMVHALGLKITRAYAENAAGAHQEALQSRASVTFIDPMSGEARAEEFESAAATDEKAQTATFSFDRALARGDWKLVAECEGSLVPLPKALRCLA